MNTIKELVNELELKVTSAYEEYVTLNNELDKHRGKQLSETNLDEVNRLLKDIQDKFAELYPAYHFIAIRHQSTVNVVNAYEGFIESLNKAGATQYPPKDERKRIIH